MEKVNTDYVTYKSGSKHFTLPGGGGGNWTVRPNVIYINRITTETATQTEETALCVYCECITHTEWLEKQGKRQKWLESLFLWHIFRKSGATGINCEWTENMFFFDLICQVSYGLYITSSFPKRNDFHCVLVNKGIQSFTIRSYNVCVHLFIDQSANKRLMWSASCPAVFTSCSSFSWLLYQSGLPRLE